MGVVGNNMRLEAGNRVYGFMVIIDIWSLMLRECMGDRVTIIHEVNKGNEQDMT